MDVSSVSIWRVRPVSKVPHPQYHPEFVSRKPADVGVSIVQISSLFQVSVIFIN